MNPYSLVLAATIAANLALLAYATARLRQRTPRLALIGFLASFAVAHAASLAFEEGSADPAILGIGFAALVFGYACLALFAVLFLRGEALRRRYPVIAAVLLPGLALTAAGLVTRWSPAQTFQPSTDPVGVAVNAYLVLCLGIAIAEPLAVWRRFPARAREGFALALGCAALVVAGPIYGFELVVLGVTAFTGTNLAASLAGALFVVAMAGGNPLPFRGRVPEGPRRIPWMVASGAYLVEETRPKYAEALFLAASHASHALAFVSGPEADTPDLAGVETLRLPPGSRCADVLAATAAEFLARHREGAVLVDDASYAVANSGLAATVGAITRVAAGRPSSGRLVVSLAKLTEAERTAFRAIPGILVAAPDVEVELTAILRAHLGAVVDPLTRAALARGKRVEDLSLVDVPSIRDYLLASLADLRSPADEAAQSGWRRVSQSLATDLETLWRTPPMEARERAAIQANAPETDMPVVRAADVLPPSSRPVRHEEPPAPSAPLGTAVRDAFLGSLGPAGEPVFRRVVGRLRKDPTALGEEDLPKLATLAEEAVSDLFGAIDVDAARRDLADRAIRLRAALNGLARGER